MIARILFILGWTFVFWFVPALAFGIAFGPALAIVTHSGSPPATHIHLGTKGSLVLVLAPMAFACLGMGLGLMGLLPGTDSDDEGRRED